MSPPAKIYIDQTEEMANSDNVQLVGVYSAKKICILCRFFREFAVRVIVPAHKIFGRSSETGNSGSCTKIFVVVKEVNEMQC